MRLRRVRPLLPRLGVNKGPTITPQERRLLWEEAKAGLTAINDLERAVDEEDWRDAKRRARQFVSLLVLCEDLGWGSEAEDDTILSSPPELLRRAFTRFMEGARNLCSHYASEVEEVSEELEKARALERTCQRILRELAAAGLGSGSRGA